MPSTEGGAETGPPDFTGQLPGVCMGSQSCLTLCEPMDCDPPVSSVLGIFQPGILEWVAISAASIGREEHPLLLSPTGQLLEVEQGEAGGLCGGPHPSSQYLQVTPSWNFLTATCAYPWPLLQIPIPSVPQILAPFSVHQGLVQKSHHCSLPSIMEASAH